MNECRPESYFLAPATPSLPKLDSEGYFHNLRSMWNSMNMGWEKLVLPEGSFPWSLTLCPAFLHSLLLSLNFVLYWILSKIPNQLLLFTYWTKSSVITASTICHKQPTQQSICFEVGGVISCLMGTVSVQECKNLKMDNGDSCTTIWAFSVPLISAI